MRPPLAVNAKYLHARRLLSHLEVQIQEYVDRRPVQVVVEEDVDNDRRKEVVRITEAPPVELALAAADVIHNARAALDHLAFQLVVRDGGTPTGSTYFPVHKQEAGWGDKARRDLKGVSAATRASVRARRPWAGGNDPLWHLHKLDIIDKHRTLLLVVAQYGGVEMPPIREMVDWLGEDFGPLPRLLLRDVDQDGMPETLEDGAVVWSEPLTGYSDRWAPGATPEVKYELALERAAGPMSAEPVTAMLAGLLDEVGGTIDSLSR